MSGIILKIDLTKLFLLTGNQVFISVPAATTRVIDFKNEFMGIAKNVLIDNRDTVNEITYRVNSRASDPISIRLNASRVVGVPVEILEINAGAAGVTQVSAEVVPLDLLIGRLSEVPRPGSV